MEPRKDYDDYASFVNDSFHAEKDKVLEKTVEMDRKRFSMDPAMNRGMNRTEVKTYSVTRGSQPDFRGLKNYYSSILKKQNPNMRVYKT